MKKAVITGVRQANLIEVPTPVAKDNWVLVKIHTIPMCTEYKSFNSGYAGDLGHEAVGEVVAVDQARHLKIGDRVVVQPSVSCDDCDDCDTGYYIHCQHHPDASLYVSKETGQATYAEYILKPDHLLSKIPDGVSYDMASLALCGLGPTFGAMEKMNVSAFDTVLVTGLGPVGMGAIVNARFRNARVIAVESLPYRVEKAKAFGVEAVIDPNDPEAVKKIRDLTGGRGPDCCVDCSGVPAAHRLCIDAVRRRGQVAFVGECFTETPLHVSDDMIRKGISLIGNWHYNLNRYSALMQVITRSPLAKDLITHTFDLRDIQKAFEVSASPEHIKILLHP